MRPQLSALRVDDLEFLLDAEGEAMHEGNDTSVDSRRSGVGSHSPQSQSSVRVVSPVVSLDLALLVHLASPMQFRRETWPSGWKI